MQKYLFNNGGRIVLILMRGMFYAYYLTII
jgi:hypothetical protein